MGKVKRGVWGERVKKAISYQKSRLGTITPAQVRKDDGKDRGKKAEKAR